MLPDDATMECMVCLRQADADHLSLDYFWTADKDGKAVSCVGAKGTVVYRCNHCRAKWSKKLEYDWSEKP